MIDEKTYAWLTELLRDCEVKPLNDFEDKFSSDIRVRFLQYGARIVLSEKQMVTLRKIDRKINAAG